MLNSAPLARAGREMANMHWHLQLDCQFLKSDFPLAATAAIAGATISVINNSYASPYRLQPILFHQCAMASAAKRAVSWSMPTITQPWFSLIS